MCACSVTTSAFVFVHLCYLTICIHFHVFPLYSPGHTLLQVCLFVCSSFRHSLFPGHLCVLCVLCVVVLFSVVEGPCKRYAMARHVHRTACGKLLIISSQGRHARATACSIGVLRLGEPLPSCHGGPEGSHECSSEEYDTATCSRHDIRAEP
jgi:hypothetical protein